MCHRKISSYYLGKMPSLFIKLATGLQSTGFANFAASIHSVTREQPRKCTASTFVALMIIGKRFQILRLNNLMAGIGRKPLRHSSFSTNMRSHRKTPPAPSYGEIKLSKSAFSLRVFSIYMLVLGSVLVAVPSLMLSFIGIPETHEVWIRVVGVPVLIIGYLNFMASGNELRLFFLCSVHARLAVPSVFTG